MTESITQTPVNMQLPPPSVTGIKIPNKLNVGSTYEKIKARHQEAVDAISIEKKHGGEHKNANKHNLSGFVKFAIGFGVGVLGAIGITRFIKK